MEAVSAGQVFGVRPLALKSALPITPNVLSTEAAGMRALSESGCTNLDGAATDTDGLGCSDYPSPCTPPGFGQYDDTDFSSSTMCCACGGGALPPSLPSPPNAPPPPGSPPSPPSPPASPPASPTRYYTSCTLDILSNRGPGTVVQLSELYIQDNLGVEVAKSGATTTCSSFPAGEGPEMAIDGNPKTKFLCFVNQTKLTVALTSPAAVVAYDIMTANDLELRFFSFG